MSLPIFIILVIGLCVGIWFSIRKNEAPLSDESVPHTSSPGKGMPVNKSPSKEKPMQAQPVATVVASVPAAPANAQVSKWHDRRQTLERRLVGERWRDWLAFSTTILAVLAVIMSLESSRATMGAVLLSGKENTQWSLYQSKTIKEYTYNVAKGALELQLAAIPNIAPEAAEKYSKAIKGFDEELKRYKDEKDEIMQEAISFGKTKDRAQKLSAGLNNSLVFLLLAVVLSSIATMVRKKYIWYVGLCMLVGWIYFFINAF